MNPRFHVILGIAALALGCGATPAPMRGTDDAASDAADAATDASDAATDARTSPSGEALVMMFGCRNCHQSMNPADGVLSGQSTPRPGTMAYGSNLTPDMATGLGGWTEDQIVRAIREGVDASGRSLCSTMPRYGAAPVNVSVETARVIAQYLRALPAVSRMIPASACR